MRSVRLRLSLILVPLVAVAGCTSSDEVAEPVDPTTAPTVVVVAEVDEPPVGVSHPPDPSAYALDWPEVAISVRELDDDEASLTTRTRAELTEDALVPEFVYGNDFSPSNIDLDPPRPVEFTNPTDDDIVIIFSRGDLPELPVAAGATEFVDFTDLPEEMYRFHVLRGNAKISGFIDMRPQESGHVPSTDAVTVRQAPFSGVFSIEVPEESEWLFNPQYDAIVGVPSGDSWAQGDFQWSMATGAALRSSGMRLRLVETDDVDAILDDAVIPENCNLVATLPVAYGSLAGMGAEYGCDWAALHLGYLETDGGYLVYAIADDASDPAEVLFAALESVEFHPEGDAVPATDGSSPVNSAYPYGRPIGYSVLAGFSDEPYPLDIEGGDLSSSVAAELTVLSTTIVELRNFDEIPYLVEANGASLVELPPAHAAAFDILEFDASKVHLTITANLLSGYGLTIDLTERVPGPPEAMYASTAAVIPMIVQADVEMALTRNDVMSLSLPVPIGWLDVGAAHTGRYAYARLAEENDPARIDFIPSLSVSIADLYLEWAALDARMVPEEVDRMVIRDEEWIFYSMAPDGHPAITAGLVRGDDFERYIQLTSSPDDHDILFESVLIPILSSYQFNIG